MKYLNELNVGEEAVVVEILTDNRRLKDIGLIQGTKIKCVLKSPLGDPAAYKIRGATIAIRKEDSSAIKVKVTEHEE